MLSSLFSQNLGDKALQMLPLISAFVWEEVVWDNLLYLKVVLGQSCPGLVSSDLSWKRGVLDVGLALS
jgi:hypothetical protein